MTQATDVATATPAPAAPPQPGALVPAPVASAPAPAATRTPEISADTGEVRRPVLVGAASALLALATVLTCALLVRCLLIMTGDDLNAAGWVVGKINPTPSSLPAVLMPIMAASIILPAAVASGVAAFQSWNGRRWTPVVASVGAGLALLGLLYGGPLSWAAISCHVVGAALLWLPRVRRYHADQTAWLAKLAQPAHVHTMPAHVHYGPLPRYRD